MTPRLKEEYNKKIKQALLKELNLSNVMSVPKLVKIVVNSGVGEATTNEAALTEVAQILTQITGQKAVITKAKTAISAFKIRKGLPIGTAVTLHGDRMWEFYDRLVNVVFPRVKDFHGLDPKAFDGSGNYSLGIREHTVFPEIDTSKSLKIRSLQITIVTSTKKDEEAKALLDKLGFPFIKNGN